MSRTATTPDAPIDEDLRRRVDAVLDAGRRRPRRTDRAVLRVATLNTHRGRGPMVPYLLRSAATDEATRIQLLHAARAYAYYIAEWLNRERDSFEVVALQEVFNGILGFGERLFARFGQHAYYRVFSGFSAAVAHGVGFAGFRYENLLLSHLPPANGERVRHLLPRRVFGLAACGLTLAPFRFDGRVVWVGNTHLHAYNPRARMVQARAIAKAVRDLGDAPVLLLGDLNTVPPGCKDGDFPDGDRDVKSYRGDQTLRILKRAGLGTIPHEDRARFHTYPTGAPNRTLDYVLFTHHFEPESYEVDHDVCLSDHYPVTASLRLAR